MAAVHKKASQESYEEAPRMTTRSTSRHGLSKPQRYYKRYHKRIGKRAEAKLARSDWSGASAGPVPSPVRRAGGRG